ncbi:MAG: hypothetical protein Q8K58_00205 [Acidimicrobiales bacterium]|nr:hypothetical protein [Acidimicrobiales bacterium]
MFDADRHDTAAFDSGVQSLDSLRKTAQVAAAAGTAATWVLCRGDRVVGYYALAMGAIERWAVPSRLGQGQPDPIPILLLPRLALDRGKQSTNLGADLRSVVEVRDAPLDGERLAWAAASVA